MNKLFTLLALAGLGISMIGCAGEKAAPPAAPEKTEAPAAGEGTTPAPEAPPADEKKE